MLEKYFDLIGLVVLFSEQEESPDGMLPEVVSTLPQI